MNCEKKNESHEPIFVGEFDLPISPLGTFVIPEKWRFITAEGPFVFLMTKKTDGSVNLMPASETKKMLANLRERALTDSEYYHALQVIGEHSSLVEVDASGVIELPEFIRKDIGLKDRVVLKGALHMIKICNPQKKDRGPCGGRQS